VNDIRKNIQKKLLTFGKNFKNKHISDLQGPNSFKENIIENDFLTFDYSKQRINEDLLNFLLEIPDLINLRESLNSLFNGTVRNLSEDKYISHTLYRNASSKDNGHISTERRKIKSFLAEMGSSSKFKNLICLSIGGSRLGPELIYEVQNVQGPKNVYFCSSNDLLELEDALRNCHQSETIVFVSSKSFETTEILKNFKYIKAWFSKVSDVNFENHLYGISANAEAMTDLGIKKSHQFVILDSLVGRFSIWSSISLPAFINTDYDSYLQLIEGARIADDHTENNPWQSNISVLMALFSIWNRNSLDINNHGIFTYDFRLRSMTKYIAQLSMESNGKSVNFSSSMSPFLTTQLIWGGYGIENQHSTFQWLMQGKTETSCDFIGVKKKAGIFCDSNAILLSQVLAMTYGREDKERPYKSVFGNNPCSILQLEYLDLRSLGFLLAIYEHKIFIEALVLGIDPFDQWGVQLGKELSSIAINNKEFLKLYFSKKVLPED